MGEQTHAVIKGRSHHSCQSLTEEPLLSLIFIFSFYLLIWLCRVLVVTHGLLSLSMWTVSSPRGVWLPDHRFNLGSLHWECGVLATAPPREEYQGILRKGASRRWKCLAKMAHPLASCPLPHLHGVHQEYSWEEKGCTPPPYLCPSELSLLSHSPSDDMRA